MLCGVRVRVPSPAQRLEGGLGGSLASFLVVKCFASYVLKKSARALVESDEIRQSIVTDS